MSQLPVAPLRSSLANLWRGWESVGGKLTLDADGLHFRSHGIAARPQPLDLALADIERAEPCWSTLMRIPIVPNGLRVYTRSGEMFQFVVWGRHKWVKAIHAARG